ncbi:hypothetical protein [Serratia sp. NA_13]|uniref:hypothetical protein n=1 Tax=Serratia sp. NA_13 TaxID=3415658 RepID=UPI004046C9E5
MHYFIQSANPKPMHALPSEVRLHTTLNEKYAAKWIPEDMTLQDYPLSYQELEPYFDKFEKVCSTAGKSAAAE